MERIKSDFCSVHSVNNWYKYYNWENPFKPQYQIANKQIIFNSLLYIYDQSWTHTVMILNFRKDRTGQTV